MKGLLLLFALVFCSLRALTQGELPVDMYTGKPGIQVPIWLLSNREIQVPVSMDYDANQVRPSLNGVPYGLGWTLSAGSSVSRDVRGLPDDYGFTLSVRGWLYNNSSGTSIAADIGSYSPVVDGSTATCDENADNNKISSFISSVTVDTEPDIFHYTVGGLSGDFVFDNNLVIRLIPYRDLKIELSQDLPDKTISGFKITTNTGLVYTFYMPVSTVKSTTINSSVVNQVPVTDTDYELYKNSVTHNTQWMLTRIDAPSGANAVFSYISRSMPSTTPFFISFYDTEGMFSSDLFNIYSTSETESQRLLSQVTLSSGLTVYFNYAADTYLLNNINIIDSRRGTITSDQQVRNFYFDYQVSSTTNFLTSISEVSGCDRRPPYQFSYRGISQWPAAGTMSYDFWGYYNGANNTIVKQFGQQVDVPPVVYIYPAELPAERYRIYPIPAYGGQQIVLPGYDRTPNAQYKLIGTLSNIKYPEGGSTNLTFESNDFYDARTAQSLLCGGFRIASATYFDGYNASANIVKNLSYKDGSNNSTGRLISRPAFALPSYKNKGTNLKSPGSGNTFSNYTGDDIWKYLTIRTNFDLSNQETTHGSPVGYQAVTVSRPGLGSAKHEYFVPGYYGETTDGSWTATPEWFARPNSCKSMGIISAGGIPWSYPYVSNPLFDYERGLLWKKSEYSNGNKLVRYTVNTYQYVYGSGTQPVTVGALKYDKYAFADDNDANNKIYLFGKYQLLTNVAKVPLQESVTTYDQLEQGTSNIFQTETTQFSYASINHKLLTTVIRTAADGTAYGTEIKYPLDYFSVPGTNAEPAALMIKNLQTNFMNGIPVEQINTIQHGAGTKYVLKGSLVKLSDFGVNKPLLESQWLLNTASPIDYSTFTQSSIILVGANYKLNFDSHYEMVSSVQSYDVNLNPSTATGMDNIPVSSGYGYTGTAPITNFRNAIAGQYIFSDFEVPPGTWTGTGNEFTVVGTTYTGTGRTGTNAFYPGTKLTKTITKAANVTNYILSFWINSATSQNLTPTLKDAGGVVKYNTPIPITATGGSFKYYSATIPISSITTSTLSLDFQETSLPTMPAGGSAPGLLPVIDDVAFYPETADFSSTTYTFPYGANATTDARGMTSYSLFDNLGRVTKVLDLDKNIAKKNTYLYSGFGSAGNGAFLLADFTLPPAVSEWTLTTFNATANPCVTSGVTYEWDFGAGYTTPSSSLIGTYTFTSTGVKTVKLRVNASGFTSVVATQTVTVGLPPIAITICAKGVKAYRSLDNSVTDTYTCASITGTPPFNGTIFQVSSITVPQNDTYTLQWMIRDVGTPSWIRLGGTSTQYTYQTVLATTKSFEIKCVATSTLGMVGEWSLSVTVTPD